MTEADDAVLDAYDLIGQNIRIALDRQRGRDDLAERSRAVLVGDATTPTGGRDVDPQVVCFPLGPGTDDETDERWSALHRTFSEFAHGNLRPWFRCLSVLRGLGAQTVIVETHYVCLDWRSEMSAYYAFLDAPRKNWTVRLHFFSESVAPDQVTSLTKDQQGSYLGYIVVREGDVPLVGRTVIRLPKYLTTSDAVTTAIDESVHFFGQDLSVRGVPFMQQDNRLAVCAHLIVWMAHYTAYRRNVVERRLVADFVASSSTVLPMRPGTREGLLVTQVIRLIRDMGLHCLDFRTPLSPTAPGLPTLRADCYPKLATHLSGLFSVDFRGAAEDPSPCDDTEHSHGSETTPPIAADTDLAVFVADRFFDLRREAVASRPEPDDPRILAVDAVLDTVLDPYLHSGLPVYLATTNHALLLLGSGDRGGRRVHYIHDETIGPYLMADSLIDMSRRGLIWQTGVWAHTPVDDLEPPTSTSTAVDVLLDRSSPMWRGLDGERGIENIIIPTPPRALLPAGAGLEVALDLINRDVGLSDTIAEESSLPQTDQTTAVIIRGTTYKAARRDEADQRGDANAVVAFASAHLAEWVCLIQGLDQTGRAVWEVILDGTSSSQNPRIQLVRILDVFVGVNPRTTAYYDTASLEHTDWTPVVAGAAADKTQDGHGPDSDVTQPAVVDVQPSAQSPSTPQVAEPMTPERIEPRQPGSATDHASGDDRPTTRDTHPAPIDPAAPEGARPIPPEPTEPAPPTTGSDGAYGDNR